jgi:ribosomal protein L32
MVCQVCGQKGHPARLCQDGKKGRANQADEDSRSIASSRSHTLKRYIAPPDDELNSAEAMKALKRAHRKNKKQGRHRRYKIVEIDESDDEDE